MFKRYRWKKMCGKMGFQCKMTTYFAMFTLLSLVITDIVIHIQLGIIGEDHLQQTTYFDDQFNAVSTNHVSEALTKYALTARNQRALILYQLYKGYQYFCQRRNQIVSFQHDLTPNPNPPLTSSFLTPQMVSGLYIYRPNATFYDDSFLDVILTTSNLKSVKNFYRANIFYWNQSDPTDMMARTLPATNDFYVGNPNAVLSRITGLPAQRLVKGPEYQDQYSISSKRTVTSIRITMLPPDRPGIRMLFQLQFLSEGFIDFSDLVFYFPTTEIIYIEISNNTEYRLARSTKQVNYSIDPFLTPGTRDGYLENGTRVISGTVGMPNGTDVNSYEHFSYGNDTSYRFVTITDWYSSNFPYRMMEAFIEKNKQAIVAVMYGFTLFIFISVIAVSLAVSDRILFQFGKITHLLRVYVKDPEALSQVTLQLRQMPFKGNLKKFQYNLIDILEKIDLGRMTINEHQQVPCQHQLNRLQRNFQKRTKLNQFTIMETIHRQLLTIHHSETQFSATEVRPKQ